MKKFFLLLLGLSPIWGVTQAFSQTDGEKSAILMVHFGTTYDDTRAKTIDAINQKVASEFPDRKVLEAYTSRIVIKRLKARGIEKLTPQEALLKLAAEGYTQVFVQATHVIDGIEAETLRNEAEMMLPFFKDIRIGHPLLYSLEDCEKVTEILAHRHASSPDKRHAIVLVGHGTHTPANAIYAQLDYLFHVQGYPNIHVATVEGFPSLDHIQTKLKTEKTRQVTLVPLMFVAGDHARNDLEGEWQPQLEAEGYQVTFVREGLGEIPEIQALYIDHIRQGLKERPLRAPEIKAAFLRENP